MVNAFKGFRIGFLVFCVIVSLVFISNIVPLNKAEGVGVGNGLDYGLDFVGGIQMQLKLDEPVDENVMAIEKQIIETRMNSLGLKDISVRPWGSQYILISVAGSSQETGDIEEILKKQARFEQRIDGELAVWGSEIAIDLGPQGMRIEPVGTSYRWTVAVKFNGTGACRFGQVAENKVGRPVDMFIDRPENTTILMTEATYDTLSETTSTGVEDTIYFGSTATQIIENRSRIPIIVYEDEQSTLARLLEKKEEGYNRIIIAEDDNGISESTRNMLEEEGFTTERMPQGNLTLSPDEWIKKLTGLQSTPKLNINTQGKCQFDAVITGSTALLNESQDEVKRTQILLTSGNLPVKTGIVAKSTIQPTLGLRSLKYAFVTGIVAFLTVSLMIYLRYKRISITLPLVSCGLSEIIVILGLASLINWQLDLPAVAGIIAAVGTGVDHLLVITDETLKVGGKKKRVFSITESLKRAFFIIFTAAATMIAAMIPLLGIGAGMLKGFAFTTIMGVMVGVLITRPAYGKMIEEILKGE